MEYTVTKIRTDYLDLLRKLKEKEQRTITVLLNQAIRNFLKSKKVLKD